MSIFALCKVLKEKKELILIKATYAVVNLEMMTDAVIHKYKKYMALVVITQPNLFYVKSITFYKKV